MTTANVKNMGLAQFVASVFHFTAAVNPFACASGRKVSAFTIRRQQPFKGHNTPTSLVTALRCPSIAFDERTMRTGSLLLHPSKQLCNMVAGLEDLVLGLRGRGLHIRGSIVGWGGFRGVDPATGRATDPQLGTRRSIKDIWYAKVTTASPRYGR